MPSLHSSFCPVDQIPLPLIFRRIIPRGHIPKHPMRAMQWPLHTFPAPRVAWFVANRVVSLSNLYSHLLLMGSVRCIASLYGGQRMSRWTAVTPRWMCWISVIWQVTGRMMPFHYGNKFCSSFLLQTPGAHWLGIYIWCLMLACTYTFWDGLYDNYPHLGMTSGVYLWAWLFLWLPGKSLIELEHAVVRLQATE